MSGVRQAMDGVEMKVKRKWRALAMSLCLALVSTAHAEIDLSGNWAIIYHEDWIEIGTGPDIADFTGLPLTPEAAQRALNWHASLVNIPERQCLQLPMEYTNRWSHTRIWKEVDSESQALVAYRLRKAWGGMDRTIHMGAVKRPPPGAVHTFAGFSIGEFDGEKLKVVTTHLKEGYSRRNGVPRSDRATITEHFMRHGNYLTISTIIEDPVYLTEPLVVSTSYAYAPNIRIGPYICESVNEIASLKKGQVPMYFPWKNPHEREFAEKYSIPLDIARGGQQQLYPDFIERR